MRTQESWPKKLTKQRGKVHQMELDEMSRQIDDEVLLGAANDGATIVQNAPITNRGSDKSSSDDSSDSEDDIFQNPPRRLHALDNDDGEISDNIAAETDATTLTGGNVITPAGRDRTGHGNLQEAGFDCSGNTTLLHGFHSQTSLTHLVPQYNERTTT